MTKASRGRRLAEAVEHSMSGPMWHGPSLAELIGDLTPAQASARPLKGVHTIWELVLHLAAWNEVVRNRLTRAHDPSEDEQWPKIPDTSAEAWRSAVQRLKDAHRDLAADVADLSDEAIKALAPNRDHSVAVMIHGIIEHDAYHGGQIAMLKKAIV
jgi:uncharacterized damage-inducible protein DinB